MFQPLSGDRHAAAAGSSGRGSRGLLLCGSGLPYWTLGLVSRWRSSLPAAPGSGHCSRQMFRNEPLGSLHSSPHPDPFFRVTAKNEEQGQEGMSCLSKVYMTLPESTVTLLKGRRTLVSPIPPPPSLQGLTMCPGRPFQSLNLSTDGVQQDGDLQSQLLGRLKWEDCLRPGV